MNLYLHNVSAHIVLAVCSEGICLDEKGLDLNSKYVDLPGDHTKEKCFSECQKKRKSVRFKMTACEHKSDGTCILHTLPVSKGNGDKSSTCCLYDPGNRVATETFSELFNILTSI